ncbi:MAG: aminoglycoside 6-adenylyltransferase, partial [Armatimonadota bacterium]|nr:aminoglycoside 6-adenylyltransferase [Armatimonadota bacterium]
MAADTVLWQADAIDVLTAHLEKDEGVKALLLIGSCADPDVELDLWSDVDIVVVVEDRALARFHPALDWLRVLGEPYAFDPSQQAWCNVIR